MTAPADDFGPSRVERTGTLTVTYLDHELLDRLINRVPCCVPGCRRTLKRRWVHQEWVCQIHYAAVPSALKLKRRAVVHRLKRRGELVVLASGQRLITTTRAYRLDQKLWHRVKRIAIEKASGL